MLSVTDFRQQLRIVTGCYGFFQMITDFRRMLRISAIRDIMQRLLVKTFDTFALHKKQQTGTSFLSLWAKKQQSLMITVA
ncbi:hypothetical protein Barb6XT_03219 [Bacteroidales bacterium Barb6XT]|nr:hypothetical protein Barb6XT_03219 [Bacteroidales bacterium Barb6XT]